MSQLNHNDLVNLLNRINAQGAEIDRQLAIIAESRKRVDAILAQVNAVPAAPCATFKPEHKACECGMKYRHDCTPSGCQHEDNIRSREERNERDLEAHYDQFDRDAGRICITCDRDLELNADFQCIHCGAYN